MTDAEKTKSLEREVTLLETIVELQKQNMSTSPIPWSGWTKDFFGTWHHIRRVLYVDGQEQCHDGGKI